MLEECFELEEFDDSERFSALMAFEAMLEVYESAEELIAEMRMGDHIRAVLAS